MDSKVKNRTYQSKFKSRSDKSRLDLVLDDLTIQRLNLLVDISKKTKVSFLDNLINEEFFNFFQKSGDPILYGDHWRILNLLNHEIKNICESKHNWEFMLELSDLRSEWDSVFFYLSNGSKKELLDNNFKMGYQDWYNRVCSALRSCGYDV